jgi:prepilin-type N-terminal cleavage/methylation domain-containing protein
MEHMSVDARCRPGNTKAGALAQSAQSNGPVQGFTLIELLFVMLIGLLMTALAIPLLNSVTGTYRLRGAVASVSGVIQSTRYQAISSGYTYQLVLKKAASTFQVQSDPNRTGTFANYCANAAASCAVPLAGSAVPVVLGVDTTLQFRPSGLVTASVGSTTLTLTYGGTTKTIAVSSYGNIQVTP